MRAPPAALRASAPAARWVLLTAVAAGVFAVVGGLGGHLRGDQGVVLLPFAAALVCAAGRPLVDRLDARLARASPSRGATPYEVLADVARQVRTGSLDEALPGLARVLAVGTGASSAGVWLAVDDVLRCAGAWPVADDPSPAPVRDLAVLIARADVDHAVPVLEGDTLRAVLVIGKGQASVTAVDRSLMDDVGRGAAHLLRRVRLNAELADGVSRAQELALELETSRALLALARDSERRRVVAELGRVMDPRSVLLLAAVDAVDADLSAQHLTEAAAHLVAARAELDELLARFRTIVRGVHPRVLRERGLLAALEELTVDLPGSVLLSGELPGGLPWAVESTLYFLSAAALQHLAGASEGTGPAAVHLGSESGSVRVHLRAATGSATRMSAALADEVERSTALGGRVAIRAGAAGRGLEVEAVLPERLAPTVAR